MSNYPDGFNGDFGENKEIPEVKIRVTFDVTLDLEELGLTDWDEVEDYINDNYPDVSDFDGEYEFEIID